MSQTDDADTLPPSMDPDAPGGAMDPPTDFLGIMRRLGPGLIIAGSIVGSGELIATTKVGAQAGITLLWLIILGCVVKVFVQVELGRYTLSHGETTLSALNQVPGPRLGVNWIVWVWLGMMLLGIGQLGAIVGGVGQSLALSVPLRGDYADVLAAPSQAEIERYLKWEKDLNENGGAELAKLEPREQDHVKRGQRQIGNQLEQLGARGADLVERVQRGETLSDPTTWDDRIWAAVITVITSLLLYRGRYSLIQNVSTFLVAMFTFITVGNVLSLQSTTTWHLSWSDLLEGLSFRLPAKSGDVDPMRTALATFGIIGVGASELIAYPYWCMEKGYARFTGPRTDDANWARRARGWLRVMRYDAFTSMVVYTIATVAFFLTGAAVLHSEGRDPDGMRMVGTLATMYVPVFGEYARWLFLIGAVAVLYSTFMAANAGNARMWVDCAKVFGVMDRHDQAKHDRGVAILSGVLPFLCLAVYCSGVNPVRAILVSGAMQSLLLPMIGIGALYFRLTRTDRRLRPTLLWDILHVVSCLGLLLAGAWGTFAEGRKLLETIVSF